MKKWKKDDKERIKTEKEAVIAEAASWNLKDLTAGNKLKHRLTQIFADGKATLYLRKDILYVNLC